MLLWVSVMVAIVGFGVFFKKGDEMSEVLWAAIFGVATGAALVAFICGMFFIGAHSPYFRKCAMTDFEEKRNAILYVAEKNGGSVVGLASDISEYNSEILKGRMRMHNVWLKNISYDFYDELELIEVSVNG